MTRNNNLYYLLLSEQTEKLKKKSEKQAMLDMHIANTSKVIFTTSIAINPVYIIQ